MICKMIGKMWGVRIWDWFCYIQTQFSEDRWDWDARLEWFAFSSLDLVAPPEAHPKGFFFTFGPVSLFFLQSLPDLFLGRLNKRNTCGALAYTLIP